MRDPTETAVEDLSAASREIDRAVHREIFGGEVERHPLDFTASGELVVPLPTFTVESGEPLPHYSDRLPDAWRIVEHLRTDPEGLPGSVHDCFLDIVRSQGPDLSEVPQQVASEIICRAALRAVRREELTIRGKCPQCGEKMEQVGYRERPGDGRAEEVYLCDACGSDPTIFAPLPSPA